MSALGLPDGDVIFPGSGHIQSQLPEVVQEVPAASYGACSGSLGQNPVNQLPHVVRRFLALSEDFCDGFQLMAGTGYPARPVRVCGVRQSVSGIDHIPEVIELPFCRLARWPDVQALAGGKLHARGNEMQLVMPGMFMPDPEDVVLIRIQTCESETLEAVHDGLFHGRGDGFTRSKGEDPGCVFVLEGQ